MAMNLTEAFARRIFEQAIRENRCGETLECLWGGGSVTVDAITGKLVLASADMLKQMGGE